jgi:hypothetical protein
VFRGTEKNIIHFLYTVNQKGTNKLIYSVVLSSIASVPALLCLLVTVSVLVFLVPFLDTRVQETKNEKGAMQKRKNRLFESALALLVWCFLIEVMA